MAAEHVFRRCITDERKKGYVVGYSERARGVVA